MSNQESTDNAIVVTNLHKTFKLPHDAHSGLKQMLINITQKNRKKGYDVQHVLKNVSFEVKKGDFFGIVGRNGSGKSTLLKLLAGIYVPDSGAIQTNGSIVPFIELGVGFNPELTGRENIFLNGALLGFSREEMKAMYGDIVEFAELEKFMNQKLKNYSSGMQVRLAFSIAIKAQGDILILDEVLAVGDEAFQRKCETFFRQIKRDKSKTIILVTHSMDSVRKYCNKAMMLHGGKVVTYGNPEDVANEYSIENFSTSTDKNSEVTKESIIRDLKITVSPEKKVSQEDEIEIKVSYKVKTKTPTRVRLSLQDINKNIPLFAASSPLTDSQTVNMILRAKLSAINDTDIKLHASIRGKDDEVLAFLPENNSPTFGLRRTDYKGTTPKRTWATLFDRGVWK